MTKENSYVIGYLEVKRAVESCKDNIKEALINLQMQRIMLKAFEKELESHPEPMLSKKE